MIIFNSKLQCALSNRKERQPFFSLSPNEHFLFIMLMTLEIVEEESCATLFKLFLFKILLS